MTGPTGEHRVADVPERSRFEITVDGKLAGLSQYRREPGRLVFTHTEIDDAYQGQGLGAELVGGALDSVRASGLSVTPVCTYVAGFIRRNPEYLDLVDERSRAEL